jgi:hypothetical protein
MTMIIWDLVKRYYKKMHVNNKKRVHDLVLGSYYKNYLVATHCSKIEASNQGST